MSVAANVKSIQALADLKSGLVRYGSDVQESLAQMERTIEQTRQSLIERQRHWQMQVRRGEEMLTQARAAWNRCQNSAYTDREGRHHTPDCRQFEQAALDAKRQLDKAVAELRNVEQAIKQVEAAIADYQRQARRLASFVNNDLKEGQAMLERKIGILQGYVAGGVIGGVVGLVANALENRSSAAINSSLPNPAGNWQPLGIQAIALEAINLGDSTVNAPEDFKKVSLERMTDGLEKLQSTVRPAVEKGADGDYFYHLDAELGLEYEHGYRRVYDAFYGNEPIRLEKVNGKYQVINGYHRLFVAQQLGIKNIPASVAAPVETSGERGESA